MPARLTRLFLGFFDSERASGVILIACTLVSLLLANVVIGQAWIDFWHARLPLDIAGVISVNYTLEHWVNDGLMTIFFLMIGLEIERELYVGELSNLRNASLPIVAAIGGMLTPVLIDFAFNQGTPTQPGFAIPMATDIAFALGALSLLGRRIPVSLKIFLTALAIIDDLGAIAVIGIFYAKDFSLPFLLAALAVFAGLLVLNRLGVRRLAFYLIPGVLMWYLMGKSGIHATITGVLLAFAIPFAGGAEGSPSARLQHFLHRPVAFLIMPLFTLANTGIVLSGDWARGLFSSNGLGIYLGLVVGKPLGIVAFSLVAVKARLSRLPADLSWKHVLGGGVLGGIGFTMSIFITLLAFADPAITQASKIAILLASLTAGIVGIAILAMQPMPVTDDGNGLEPTSVVRPLYAMTDLTILPTTEADAAELARLNGLFNGATLTPVEQAEHLRAAAGTERALLAWVDGRAVGFTCLRFARLITTALPYAEVSELFVEEAFRRRGIARALLAEAETLARVLGAPGVTLFTGLKNESAQAFYRAVGYHDYAVTMRKVFGE